jgi:hypothetical protein
VQGLHFAFLLERLDREDGDREAEREGDQGAARQVEGLPAAPAAATKYRLVSTLL